MSHVHSPDVAKATAAKFK